MISAPFRTQIASVAIDPNNRSDGFSFPKSFPITDLFDTETKIGKFCLIKFRFFMICKSRSNQSDWIFVKKGPFPDFLKNPIEGSKTSLFFEKFIMHIERNFYAYYKKLLGKYVCAR